MFFRFFKESVKQHFNQNDETIRGQSKLVGGFIGASLGALYGATIGFGLQKMGVAGGSYLCSKIGSAVGTALGSPCFYYATKPVNAVIATLQGTADAGCLIAAHSTRFNQYYETLVSKAALGDEQAAAAVKLLCVIGSGVAGPTVFTPIGAFLLPNPPGPGPHDDVVDGAELGRDYGQIPGSIIGYLIAKPVGKFFSFTLAATAASAMRVVYDPTMWAVKKCQDRSASYRESSQSLTSVYGNGYQSSY